MTLAEIAKRITEHLKVFESDPTINAVNRSGSRPYYNAFARPAGSRVAVVYVSYQSRTCLTKTEALRYLEWLDAGNVGKHWTAPERKTTARGTHSRRASRNRRTLHRSLERMG